MTDRDLPTTEEEIAFFLQSFAAGVSDSLKVRLLFKSETPLAPEEDAYVRLGSEAAMNYVLEVLESFDDRDMLLDFIHKMNVYLKMHQSNHTPFPTIGE
jgi:hypothetical protein